MMRPLYVTILALALALGGCASQTVRDIGLDKIAPRKAEKLLSAGLRQYEDGDYKAAAASLREALDAGLTFTSDKLAAHKYLAFIYCASGQERACRDEFHRAFELDPQFSLEPAEQGHPLWGPVYRQVKAEMGSRRGR